MNYWFLSEAACNMRMSVACLKKMCEQSQIEGAIRFGRIWVILRDEQQTDIEQSKVKN